MRYGDGHELAIGSVKAREIWIGWELCILVLLDPGDDYPDAPSRVFAVREHPLEERITYARLALGSEIAHVL